MKTNIFAVALSFAMLLFSSCHADFDADTGFLKLNIRSGSVLRLIEPSIDMEIDMYRISGEGPMEHSFYLETGDASENIGKLKFGAWSIVVEAVNKDGTVIASGSSSAIVNVGEISNVEITVFPLEGTGALALNVTWNSNDIENVSLEGKLVAVSGAEMPLDFTVDDGEAELTESDVTTKYHTLIVRLHDTGIPVMGAVEVVRIVKDETTEGHIDFDEINRQGGGISVNIDADMENPLEVTINGTEDEIQENGSMTVTASISEEIEGIIYAWYINAEPQEMGDEFTVEDLTAGLYYMSLTAFTADGKRAGSANHFFKVTTASEQPTVLCTGQDKCYNNTTEIPCSAPGEAFYGQDAQYADLGYCIPKSYTVSGTAPEEIVTDDNTGLQWQRTLSASTFTWENAIVHCENLTYGGYNDWRLPSRKELDTLVDYGRFEPAINKAYFSDTQNGYYWTNTTYIGNTDRALIVDFELGFSQSRFKTESRRAKCVRGTGWNPVSIFEESEIEGKTIVTDLTTGLVWTKDYVTNFTWQNALSHCETLDYAGYTDWRLPSMEELKTLIDDTKNMPVSSFPETPVSGAWSYFWSSTSLLKWNQAGWHIIFWCGHGHYYVKTDRSSVRCVR
jgi:hypothetical protein